MWTGVLPIGSVVLLKDSTRKLMITGYCMQRESDQKIFDYGSVLWPDGFESITTFYLFNQDQIERVYYVGYSDRKTEELMPKIADSMKELKNGN